MAKTAVKKEKSPAIDGVLRRDGADVALGGTWAEKIALGWSMKERIAQIEREIERINGDILAAFAPGDVLIVPGVCRVSVANRQTIKIIDAERLEEVVGTGRFIDLVREEVSYKAEPKLVDMACDADEPLSASIRECLAIKTSVIATWRAEGNKEVQA